ncbi:unnamed protein product [[Candida] boidinii]|uniref:Unnamed protein product n=1 Tax=Candida boidinii TaxID=5477 RepID=A0A9W6WH08_CANBO|nr:hypothetical protein BVG19_g34 [[Candida] boidinii]OWB52266.1 hypothetical protein B5S27_g3839 [[Candida] boidinii]OWB65197.1 hypothetical protein B5S30_g521 [[Candida] boidinii]OWB85053.1 hypothetical protein B5S33_g3710 [[Candida] boidinii]GME70275.1 unnamed protein product [[Candida] boidinii]
MISYDELIPIGGTLIIAGLSFGIGVIYGNLPYDFFTLFRLGSEQKYFDLALQHYQVWGTTPEIVKQIAHIVIGIAFVGGLIKIYKPPADTSYFEYGSLFVMVIGVAVYLSNVRIGVASALVGDWGEVDQNTGLGVIAASEMMIIVLFLGVIVLQIGLVYAHYADLRLKSNFIINELKIENNALLKKLSGGKTSNQSEAKAEETKSSGSSTSTTEATTTKKSGKKSKKV